MSRRGLMAAGVGGAVSKLEAAGAVPTVEFGSHRISRVIVGVNPVSGNSHSSPELDAEMRDYFTAANVKQLLAGCEAAGINTWQSRGDRHILRMLNEYRNQGGRIQWIGQTASELADIPRNIRDMAAAGAMGIYHHGTATDRFWKAGKIDQVRELLKAIRATGARVGLGTHIPEVIDYVESKGWDLDFYMACVYNMSRAGDVFVDADREQMLARVKRTARQCLIFKVYAAGRQCDSPERRRQALELVFRYAKPSDAVVIGMYPKHSEQVRENCRLVREVLIQYPA